MKDKVNVNWYFSLLILIVATLSVVLVQRVALAAWQAPVADPGDNSGVQTPLVIEDGDVDVDNNDLINIYDLSVTNTATISNAATVGSLATSGSVTSASVETADLTVNSTMDVTATNSEIDISSSSILSPPVIGSEGVQAIMATAGKNTQNNAYTYGLHATTLSNSGSYSSYAVAGFSENAGGVGVYGVANAGWAGYFSGPVGIKGSVYLGDNTTASGVYSLAGGDSSTASGNEAVALGFSSTASGGSSLAVGSEAAASGFASIALGMNPTASGLYAVALGHYAIASGDYAVALGNSNDASGNYALALGSNMRVTGTNSVGINLTGSSNFITKNNVLAIMGGDVGIGVDPGYKLHLVGDYYQDGMMQIQPTTALISTENLIYGNAPSLTSNSAHLLRLQSNGIDKFRVTSLGAVVAASSLSATSATLSSGLTVSGSASLNGGGTFANTLAAKTGAVISFNASSGSYFDFNDDGDLSEPLCKAGSDGIVYNFTKNKVLCYCDGTSWISMVNEKSDSLCSAK
ncbi:hypothetical protein HOD19_02780 [bacterium]|jgi:trimeric autotransporter adhesin|nr:hypothetical protein [bacterium]MBT4649285.1 hypothetical protein [bacterium]